MYIPIYRYMTYSHKMLGFSMAFLVQSGQFQVRAKLVLVTLRNQAGALGQAAAGSSNGGFCRFENHMFSKQKPMGNHGQNYVDYGNIRFFDGKTCGSRHNISLFGGGESQFSPPKKSCHVSHVVLASMTTDVNKFVLNFLNSTSIPHSPS